MSDSLIVKYIEVYYFDISCKEVYIVTINYHCYVFGQVPELTYAGYRCISQRLFPRACHCPIRIRSLRNIHSEAWQNYNALKFLCARVTLHCKNYTQM